MRSQRIAAAVTLVTSLLVAMAIAVAAVRSRAPEAGEGVEPPAAGASRGAAAFDSVCASCHPAARSIEGAERYAAPGGREALIDLLLAGKIGGEEGAHPDSSSLGDEDLAALANHLLALWAGERSGSEGPPPLLPEEIATHRDAGTS